MLDLGVEVLKCLKLLGWNECILHELRGIQEQNPTAYMFMLKLRWRLNCRCDSGGRCSGLCSPEWINVVVAEVDWLSWSELVINWPCQYPPLSCLSCHMMTAVTFWPNSKTLSRCWYPRLSCLQNWDESVYFPCWLTSLWNSIQAMTNRLRHPLHSNIGTSISADMSGHYG